MTWLSKDGHPKGWSTRFDPCLDQAEGQACDSRYQYPGGGWASVCWGHLQDRNEAKGRAWREANKERHDTNGRRWNEANKARVAATSKSRRERDGERIAAVGKAWYEANKERIAPTKKAWREANKERIAANAKAWAVVNSERKADNSRRWRLANLERERTNARRWNEANKERRAATSKARYEADKERIGAATRARNMVKRQTADPHYLEMSRNAVYERRSRKLGAFVEVVLRSVVWARDGGICQICFLPADPDTWQMDHRIPLGPGPHSYDNCRVTCQPCNGSKNYADKVLIAAWRAAGSPPCGLGMGKQAA